MFHDPWFVFFIMSYKFTYGKEIRGTQFKCPCCKLPDDFDDVIVSISNKMYNLMNLIRYDDNMVDFWRRNKNKNRTFNHVKAF